jgi:hypothetical protein
MENQNSPTHDHEFMILAKFNDLIGTLQRRFMISCILLGFSGEFKFALEK